MSLKKSIKLLVLGNVICFLLLGILLLLAEEGEVGGLIWALVAIVASVFIQVFVYKMNPEFFNINFRKQTDEK
jgi:NhaP-type Na+/H+ or K+/H+ antiporter